jgi:hypothetical protein
MNIDGNRVSDTLTEEQLKEARALFERLNELFPFFVGLTKEERNNIPKISVYNRQFVADAITASQNNMELMPAFINVEELRKDLTLFDQLDDVLILSQKLTAKLQDTQMLAGSEAYTSALIAYRVIQTAAGAGRPGASAAYDMLKERFAGQKSATVTPEKDA